MWAIGLITQQWCRVPSGKVLNGWWWVGGGNHKKGGVSSWELFVPRCPRHASAAQLSSVMWPCENC